MRTIFAALAAFILAAAPALAHNKSPVAHVNAWHGLGAGHQDGNEPGDTAQDRHNFDAATAGKSGHNPTY